MSDEKQPEQVSLRISDVLKLLTEWKVNFGDQEVFIMTEHGMASPIVEMADFTVHIEGQKPRKATLLVSSQAPSTDEINAAQAAEQN